MAEPGPGTRPAAMTRDDGPLRLTVLGSAAAWSMTTGNPSSAYLVELGGAALLLDIGQGSFAALAARRDPASLAGIVVSHLHPDHCVDLVPLRHYLKYGRVPPGSVPLFAPAPIRERFDAFVGEAGFLEALPGDPLVPGTLDVGPFRVEAVRVTHTDSSFAVRVSRHGPHGPGLVYSGDCGRADDLRAVIRPGDTLLVEASWGAEPVDPAAHHLDAAAAAGVARDGSAGRLVLTHLMAHVTAARALRVARRTFAGPVLLARPGLVVDVA